MKKAVVFTCALIYAYRRWVLRGNTFPPPARTGAPGWLTDTGVPAPAPTLVILVGSPPEEGMQELLRKLENTARYN